MDKGSLKNPYGELPEEPRYEFGIGLARGAALAFLLLIAVPGILAVVELIGNGAPPSASETLEGTLREWESHFEDAALFEKWRGRDQGRLVRWFSEGNSRVVIGRDGWLFYRPDIDAAVGKGPRYVEPPSVARAPSDQVWQPPLPVVKKFAEQLEERDIRLVIVPVPTKAMIETTGFGDAAEASRSFWMASDWDSVREEIESYGVEFVDLVPLFSEIARAGDVFLRQDTHWTPQTMEAVADLLATRLAADSSGGQKNVKQEVSRESQGDLVDMLSLEECQGDVFPAEDVFITRILDPSSNLPLLSDSDAPLVLLGDSFVNVFEDPSLGFDINGEEKIGAGFSSHLADRLGQNLHVIAINGGGATDVRKSLAALPDDQVREKEAVVWLISARDLFLAEVPARRAGISWEPVTFSTRQREKARDPEALVLSGVLSERSQAGDPKQTPYASALYSGIFTEIEVESGSYAADEAWVFLWAFREREILPSAHLQTGKRYRLRLVPLPESGPEASATQIDDFFRVDLERLFATEFEEAD